MGSTSYLTDDDEFNDTLDALGLEEDQPLIDFEQDLSFYSYRVRFYDLESAWLAAGADDNTDPMLDSWIADAILATIASEGGAWMVGSTIHWVSPTGEWYEITNGDCAALQSLMADPHTLPPGTYKIEISCDVEECECEKVRDYPPVYWDSQKKKVVQRLSHTCGSHNGTPMHYTRQRTMRKILFGLFWKRFKTEQGIDLYADPFDLNCDQRGYYQRNGLIKRRRQTVEIMYLNPDTAGCINNGHTCARFYAQSATWTRCIGY